MKNQTNKTPWLLPFLAVICLMAGIAGFSPREAAAAGAGQSDCANKTIVMGTSPDYPPYENVDAKNSGEIVGLDIDIAKHIAGKLGCKLQISGMDFNGLIAALQTGRVDFVMSAMSVTDERKKSIDFSQGYYTARNTIVSRSGDAYATADQLKGKKVGVQLGSTQETTVSSMEGLEQVVKLNKITDLIQALKAKRIDAAIVEDAVAAEQTGANPDLKFAMIPSGAADEGYAIAFPKGSPLREAFDAELAAMKKDGTLDSIVAKWFNETNKPVVSSTSGLNFGILSGYVPYIFRGVWVTLLFTLVSVLAGFIWGIVLSLFKLSPVRPLRWFATVYTSIFRGTPLLLQLFLIYYATPQLFHYDIPALAAAGLALGLNSAAYLSETIRGGILAVDKGQREAALALGLSPRITMQSIIFPQAVKNILPALVNECVALLKESSLVSVIGVTDLMRRVNVVQADTGRAFEPLLLAGAIYYVLVLILTSLAHLLERRLRRGD